MRAISVLILAISIVGAAASASAQTASLETRMGSAQFRASGLHKLDVAELRALEQWVATQSPDQAKIEEARAEGRREAAQTVSRVDAPPEAVSSTLVGRFEGFRRGREYTLANGQVWKQVGETAMEGMRAEAPAVEIQPARLGGWWLRVDGYNMRARVERVR